MRIGRKTLGKTPAIAGVVTDRADRTGLTKAARTGADLIELRLDTVRVRKGAAIITALKSFRKSSPVPVLLTIRSKKEGGRYLVKDDERLRLFKELTPYVDGIDIELSSKKIIKGVVREAKKRKKLVVVSFHDFKGTPGEKKLDGIVTRAKRAGADAVKIAASVASTEHVKRLATLVATGKDLIVIGMDKGMNKKGAATRVFFPLIGSLITYGSVTSSTAPGQMSVKELKKELARCGH